MYKINRAKRWLKSSLLSKAEPSSGVFRDLGLFDPSIGSGNLGDLIIQDSVQAELTALFPNDYFVHYPTHLRLDFEGRDKIRQRQMIFVGGTNLLSSFMDVKNQWKIDKAHISSLRNKVVLFGVGWWQYQSKPNSYTRDLLGAVLSKDRIHSVRDEYTKSMLESIGIKNVVNTTCPTLWRIEDSLPMIPREKSAQVVTTLTSYKADIVTDKLMLDILCDNYEKVHLWIQNIEDIDYLKTFYDVNKLNLVAPTLSAYNDLLSVTKDLEYVGTRLHAGVRAMQKCKRTLILAVDNRAIEIAKDTGLNVIARENVKDADRFISSAYVSDIRLPKEMITKWKSQFS